MKKLVGLTLAISLLFSALPNQLVQAQDTSDEVIPSAPFIDTPDGILVSTSQSVRVTWSTFRKGGGMWWFVTENGETVHEAAIKPLSTAQYGSVFLTDRELGYAEYRVYLCNDAGCAESMNSLEVSFEEPGFPIINVPQPEIIEETVFEDEEEVIEVPTDLEEAFDDVLFELFPLPPAPPQVLPENETSPEDAYLLVNPFSDLRWGDEYYEAAITAFDQGWFHGNPDGTARLSDPINRADFVTLVVKAFDLSVRQVPYGMTTFNDVEEGVWFESILFTASQHGIINCCGDYDFRPWDTLIRAEALKMVLGVAGYDYSAGEPQYSDVGFHWYSGYASYSKRTNLIDADEEGKLHPFAEMTRGEAIELITRVLALG